MLLTAEHRVASSKAYSIKDGPSTIDGRGPAENKKLIAAQQCTAYQSAKLAYLAGDISVGEAIIGPYSYNLW
jgi:hypothetical protein